MLSMSLGRVPGLQERKLAGWTFKEEKRDFEQKEAGKWERVLILRVERGGGGEGRGNLMIAKAGEGRAASI